MRLLPLLAATWALWLIRPDPMAAQDVAPHVLVVSDQVRHELTLVYSGRATELLGCLIGRIHGDTVRIDRIAPAHVDPAHSTPIHVLPQESCEDAGWKPVIGTVHNHPEGQNCWFVFPGTRVPASDGKSFLNGTYPLSAILCGPRLIWVTRDLVHHELGLAAPPP